MKTFYFNINETLSKTVRVQAETEDEAREKIQEAYDNGEIILTMDDINSSEIFDDTEYVEGMLQNLPFLAENYQEVK
jgi:hypothetical protein